MGRCACLESLKNLLQLLLPLIPLQVKIPGIQPNLVAMANNWPMSAISSLDASMKAYIRWAINLPPIPISLNLATQIMATSMAAEQIQASLGESVYTDGPLLTLPTLLKTLRINLRLAMMAVPNAKAGIFPLTDLSGILSTVALFRAAFGFDLLMPGVAIKLSALISKTLQLGPAAGPYMVSAQVRANVQAWMSLAMSARLMGGLPNLLPRLALLGQIRIPPIDGQLMLDLADLFALTNASWNISNILQIDPFGINAVAQIRLALAPLLELEPMTMNQVDWPASSSFLPPITAQIMADIEAMLSMNLNLMVKLPNLTPLSMVASVNAAFPVTGGGCGGGCPING